MTSVTLSNQRQARKSLFAAVVLKRKSLEMGSQNSEPKVALNFEAVQILNCY